MISYSLIPGVMDLGGEVKEQVKRAVPIEAAASHVHDFKWFPFSATRSNALRAAKTVIQRHSRFVPAIATTTPRILP
jgi:hypothetical protein